MNFTDSSTGKSYNETDSWLASFAASGYSLFSDPGKARRWIFLFFVGLVTMIWLDLSGIVAIGKGHIISICALFLILLAHSNLRISRPDHYYGMVLFSLVMLGFSVYLIIDRRYAFETEKLFSGVLILFLTFLGVGFKIKKSLSPFVALGRAKSWMSFHIYSGLTCFFALLFHINFHFPVGFFSNILFYVFLVFILLGLMGLYLQKIIPIKLADLEFEVVYEKIPEIIGHLRGKIQTLLSELGQTHEISKVLSAFCEQEVFPFFLGPVPNWRYFYSSSTGVVEKLHKFEKVVMFLSEREKQALTRIREVYLEKQQIDVHRTLQWIIRQWLSLHVILSALFITLGIYHVVMVVTF